MKEQQPLPKYEPKGLKAHFAMSLLKGMMLPRDEFKSDEYVGQEMQRWYKALRQLAFKANRLGIDVEKVLSVTSSVVSQLYEERNGKRPDPR